MNNIFDSKWTYNNSLQMIQIISFCLRVNLHSVPMICCLFTYIEIDPLWYVHDWIKIKQYKICLRDAGTITKHNLILAWGRIIISNKYHRYKCTNISSFLKRISKSTKRWADVFDTSIKNVVHMCNELNTSIQFERLQC